MNYTNAGFFATAIATGLAGAIYMLSPAELEQINAAISDAGQTPKTVFLRFPDEQTAKNILSIAGLYVQQDDAGQSDAGQWVLGSQIHALDVIGKIKTAPTITNVDDGVIVGGNDLPGWHVNYIGSVPLPSEVLQYAIQPETPYRDFAR